MRIVVCLTAVAIFALPASADSVAVTLENFGLMGIWANDCAKEITATQPSFRMVIAEPPGGASIHRTISSDGANKMTINSLVLAAIRTGERQMKLTLRIFGGDRNGGQLPSPTTSTFDQTIEMMARDRLRIVGADPESLERCRD